MNIALPDLYEHQEDLRDRIRAALAKHRRVILCAGCGTGKTRIAKWVLGASANRQPGDKASGKSLFVVQGRPLVDNASNSFSEAPELPHGIIMADRDTAYGARVQVASIDTMLSWFIDNNEYPSDLTFDLIVHDECDSHFSKFARFLKYHDARREQLRLHEAYGIGLSATPQAKGLADVYKELVSGLPTDRMIENGFLSPFRYFRAKEGQLDKLVKRGGEFTKKSEGEAMGTLSGDDLVSDWKRFAEGRPTVGFFPRRSQARDAMTQLEAAGLRVAYVDANTPDEVRWAHYYSLNDGRLDYLCNVNLVGRGTDIPAVSCLQMCVAMASVRAWIQKLGRGSRVDDGTREDGPDVPAKVDCIVLDHGGNLKRGLGFFEDERHWSLDITTKDPGEAGARPTIECPACQAIYRGGLCKHCGYEPSKRERRGQGLEFDGTELREVQREKKPKPVRSAEEMMISALYIAGRSGRTWRQACGMFKGMCEKAGTPHRVPSSVSVAGHRYRCIRYGSDDSNRRVSVLYPFTVNRGEHGGGYLEDAPAEAAAPY